MATPLSPIERRRSQRVLLRIPVKVFCNAVDGRPVQAAAEAVAVSRYGALLRAPLAPARGTTIEVLNNLSQEVQEFRVVRVGETPREGLYDLGVEILSPHGNFWGIHFPKEERPA